MVEGYSVKNTRHFFKPNEDLVFYDESLNFYIVLDGVSRDKINGVYPNPSPAAIAAEIIRKESYEYFAAHYHSASDIEQLLLNAALSANEKVKQFNFTQDLDFAAGAVGIIGCMVDSSFYYLYIGDCCGRTILGNAETIFTMCQTANIAKHKKEYTTHEIRNIICNNPHHKCGYGVINGDPRASFFMKTGKMNQEDFERIILSTDGAEACLQKFDIKQLQEKSAKDMLDFKIDDHDDMSILIIGG